MNWATRTDMVQSRSKRREGPYPSGNDSDLPLRHVTSSQTTFCATQVGMPDPAKDVATAGQPFQNPAKCVMRPSSPTRA
jgi:hypothetical protein